jgi:hypothetical protein
MSLQELLKELRGLEFVELVDLYLEAKTGKPTGVLDLLPVEAGVIIYELQETIKEATKVD